jgi:transglutaminase-like putative cysteine protease
MSFPSRTVPPVRVRGAAIVLLLVLGAACGFAQEDDVRARLSAVGDGAKYDADAVVVLDATEVVVQASGIGRSTSRHVVKVLREGAIAGQSVRRFDFDPTTNRFELLAVRVHRADGSVEEVPVASAVVQPNPQWGIFWASDQVVIGVPRLHVGDTVETVTAKTGSNVAYLGSGATETAARVWPAERALAATGAAPGFGAELEALAAPMPGHWYDEVSFWSSIPVIEKSYTVRIPASMRLQYGVFNGELSSSVRVVGDDMVYRFERRDIPAFKSEPKMPSTRDTECKLVLATLEDWEKKSRWFYERNEDSFAVDDEIRAKVAEIVGPCSSDEEKITALNHWVAENIRYVGTSRGACEGYTTHPVQETFRDRGGVCKDKAGLLVAMLRVAGFESYIVMTQAGTDVSDIPADQFNHAVTCVARPDGSLRLLDPTWMPKSRENWSSAEQLQYVIYGTPQGRGLDRSPYSGPEQNAVAWEGVSTLSASGALHGKLTVTAEGAPETALRRALAGRHPSDRPATLDAWMGAIGATARVVAHAHMDPVDFSGPMKLTAEFEAPAYALGAEGRLFFRLPALRRVMGDTLVGDLNDIPSADSRKYGVRLRSTRRMELHETVRLPDGWVLSEPPESREVDGPAASLKFNLQVGDGKLEYSCVVDVKQRTVAAADVQNLKQVFDALRDISDGYLVSHVPRTAAGQRSGDEGAAGTRDGHGSRTANETAAEENVRAGR